MIDFGHDILIRKTERELKRRRIVDVAKIQEATALLMASGDEDRLKKIETRQDELLRKQMMRGGRPAAENVEWLRQRDATFVTAWESKRNHKQPAMSGAERVAKHVAQHNEIGELQTVKDQARRDRCENDALLFGYTYFADYKNLLPRPASAIIIDYVAKTQKVLTVGGRLGALLPRGYGKSTWAKICAIWALVYGHCDFLPILGPTQDHANDFLKEIADFISTNDRLAEDFPEVCIPFRLLAGKYQRAIGQTYQGVPTRITMIGDTLKLPTITGSKASGAILKARGITAGFLGLVEAGKRPKAAIIDDAQTREAATAPSKTEIDSIEATIMGGVMGLGGHDHPIGILMTGTVIDTNDLNDRFADRDRHPEFVMLRHGLVKRWPLPSAESLWKEYYSLWREDKADGDEANTRATAWYSAHRDAMDAGAELSDENLFDTRFELSALQHAYNLRFTMGDDAFMAEMQNSPPKAVFVGYEVDEKLVASRINGLPRFQAPGGARAIFAFTDINHDKLRWCVVSHSHDTTAAVLCHGVWPDQGNLVPRNSSELDQKKLIYKGLADLHARLEALPLKNANGTSAKIRAWGIDRGYAPDVVHRFCSNVKASFAVLPCKGYAATQYRPSEKHMVGERGHQCHMTDDNGKQWLAVNVDYWKEVVQRSFLSEPLSPGSCSLFGTSRNDHWEFASNICAEVLTDKAVSAKGFTFWKFSLKPGAENGFLDCAVGTFGLASWYRVFRIGLATVAAPNAPVVKTSRPIIHDTRKARVPMRGTGR